MTPTNEEKILALLVEIKHDLDDFKSSVRSLDNRIDMCELQVGDILQWRMSVNTQLETLSRSRRIS